MQLSTEATYAVDYLIRCGEDIASIKEYIGIDGKRRLDVVVFDYESVGHRTRTIFFVSGATRYLPVGSRRDQ